jgi:hypothetical protein
MYQSDNDFLLADCLAPATGPHFLLLFFEEENEYNTLCRNEGAEDSEDDLDDDILNEDSTMDRAAFEHENLAATLDDEITEGGG